LDEELSASTLVESFERQSISEFSSKDQRRKKEYDQSDDEDIEVKNLLMMNYLKKHHFI
jgi:hypothetical protein